MSKFSENKTQFKDLGCLLEALTAMGFDRKEIEVNEKVANLFDYHGSKTKYLNGVDYDTAEVILRRGVVNSRLSGGASNDIGFKKNSDGTYSAIISAYDSNYANQGWLTKLKVNYADAGIRKQAKAKGFRYVGTTQTNGKRRLQFTQA